MGVHETLGGCGEDESRQCCAAARGLQQASHTLEFGRPDVRSSFPMQQPPSCRPTAASRTTPEGSTGAATTATPP
ncbi:hypothetical protein ATSB10_38150 [Dyella thiooxydans]|uniref:Uncharacterized protein n=1 Tax=Dyella thiooxydans TaxID=445710 RepID=A0A161JJR1_9GAMM|nr:hypothetical protein ATSB10_38150 [Dyella thiooxydans]